MTIHPRRSTHLLVLALLLAFAGPALAADATNPATPAEPAASDPLAEAGVAPDAAPADSPAEPATEPPAESALDSALEQSLDSQYGDCVLFCDGQQVRYSFVTRDECCSGSLTCPDGSTSTGYAFYPYDGFAEFCSV